MPDAWIARRDPLPVGHRRAWALISVGKSERRCIALSQIQAAVPSNPPGRGTDWWLARASRWPAKRKTALAGIGIPGRSVDVNGCQAALRSQNVAGASIAWCAGCPAFGQAPAQAPEVAIISRIVSSHLPQHIATPSSNCSSSNDDTPDASDERIVRSETDLHTQTIMIADS